MAVLGISFEHLLILETNKGTKGFRALLHLFQGQYYPTFGLSLPF